MPIVFLVTNQLINSDVFESTFPGSNQVIPGVQTTCPLPSGKRSAFVPRQSSVFVWGARSNMSPSTWSGSVVPYFSGLKVEP